MVSQGFLGDITLVRAYEGVDELAGLQRPAFWKGDPMVAGGGSFIDMGCHKFAAIEYILGAKAESIITMMSRQATNRQDKAEDNAFAMVRFRNGAMGEICTSFTQLTTPNNTMEIYGTKGTILEDHSLAKPVKIFSYDERMGEGVGRWQEPEIEHAAYPGYYLISANKTDEYFAECVLENKPIEFTPADSARPIADVMAGYLSFIEKRWVDVDEVEKMADEALKGKGEGSIGILKRLCAALPTREEIWHK
jgi:predicted dehydrogenase